jgi:hypothetical protein
MKTSQHELSLVCRIILALLFTGVPGTAGAQSPQEKREGQPAKQEGLTLKTARKIEFSTDEGTWISLDVSSDGRAIVFDLVGQESSVLGYASTCRSPKHYSRSLRRRLF